MCDEAEDEVKLCFTQNTAVHLEMSRANTERQSKYLNEKNLVKNSFHDAYLRCNWARQQVAAETAQPRKTRVH